MPDPDALATARRFLAEVWADNTEDEALLLWRRVVKRTPDRAEADLAALDAVADDPETDVHALLREHGEIGLYRASDGERQTPYSDAESRAWLKAMIGRLRATAAEHAAGG
jgi:hypothetical protein